MTAQEMKEEYMSLYGIMAQSKKPENMKAFGNVMNEMMDYLIQTKPDVAEEMIQKLESIKWRNYLSPKEAQKIVDKMNPKAPWSYDVWKNAMAQYGLPMDEEPHYNCFALWVEMNKMYSDFGDEIAGLLGKQLTPTDADIITACYKMALKTLKDRDEQYKIRKYFDV